MTIPDVGVKRQCKKICIMMRNYQIASMRAPRARARARADIARMRASPWRHVLVLACAHALVLASIDTKPCRQARLDAKRMRLDDGKRTALTPGDALRQRRHAMRADIHSQWNMAHAPRCKAHAPQWGIKRGAGGGAISRNFGDADRLGAHARKICAAQESRF